MKTTNEKLRTLQMRLESTDKEFARILGVSYSAVISWRRNPQSAAYRNTPESIVRLAELLIVDRERAIKFPQSEY